MSNEQVFLDRLGADPSDDSRAVYADWLEASGRSHEAAFLRSKPSVSHQGTLRDELDPAWVIAISRALHTGFVQLIRMIFDKGTYYETTQIEYLPLAALDDELLALLRFLGDCNFFDELIPATDKLEALIRVQAAIRLYRMFPCNYLSDE